VPKNCWEVSNMKTKVICMTNKLASWNLRIEEVASQCQKLTVQLLMGLRSKMLSHRQRICSMLDALTLLDFLSGYVSYMTSTASCKSFTRPVICPIAGKFLLLQDYVKSTETLRVGQCWHYCGEDVVSVTPAAIDLHIYQNVI
jgi:DNA mismatch repair ATPase MutS